jgi:tRNA A22 N-methylase|tara:strand:- start:300 stop:506 length:207 start_codon:yes stop_codon:yes gene_type:complete
MTMKKYKVRIFGMGIDAVAIIPFDDEPTREKLENNVAYYLNNNLMKVELENFYSKNNYTITYEEITEL